MRIKDLFCMGSGFPYPGDTMESSRQVRESLDRLMAGGGYTVRQLSQALGETALAFDPGTHWKYGFSHDILGALIEVLSGKSFGAFLHDEIFEPLGMPDTFFRVPKEKRPRLCTWYERSPEGEMSRCEDRDEHIQPEARFESGGGGLVSTLGDYTRFAQTLTCGGELRGVRILGRKTIALMASNHLTPQQLADFDWPQNAGYGYGLGVKVMIDPQAGGCNGSQGEFGWSGLLGTWVMMDPIERLSAVYMQQMLPNLEGYHQPRLRGVIYGSL